MTLHEPFRISARLLPALKVGDGWISLEYVGNAGSRMVFRWYIDIPAGEFSEADLKSGVFGASLQEMFGTLLAFLGAAAEAYRYEMGGRKSENADLFPAPVVEWAYRHGDEITMLQLDIEESGKVLINERGES